MQGRPTQSQINTLIAGYVLQQLGFQVASQSIIPQILKRINPDGGTAFRDSLIAGCNLLIRLAQLLQQTGTADNWNIVHVILTDGDDAGSKTDLTTTLKLLAVIGQLLNVKTLKIVLIGVGVSAKAENQMKRIAQVGGQNAEYYSASDNDIGTIFQRITFTLGLERRQQVVGVANNRGAALFIHEQVQPVLQLNVQNYAVLFNLDVSGSMAGPKWKNVCQSVDRFVGFLGENDLIAAMVFNHEAKLLAKINLNDPLFQGSQDYRAPPRNVSPPPRPVSSQPQYQYNQQQQPRYQKPRGKQEGRCYCDIM